MTKGSEENNNDINNKTMTILLLLLLLSLTTARISIKHNITQHDTKGREVGIRVRIDQYSIVNNYQSTIISTINKETKKGPIDRPTERGGGARTHARTRQSVFMVWYDITR